MKFIKSISLQEDLENKFTEELEETETSKIIRDMLNHVSQAYYLAYDPNTTKKVEDTYYGSEIKETVNDLLDLLNLSYYNLMKDQKQDV